MTFLELFIFMDLWAALWIFPILYIWCYKRDKSIRDGLRDWLDESEDDI